jgi:hypothetical protein
MNEQERLTELQRLIATARGWTDLRAPYGGTAGPLYGVLHADEGRVLVPRWPWDIVDAWELVREFTDAGFKWAIGQGIPDAWMDAALKPDVYAHGTAPTPEEAICHAWCDWKGVDTSSAERQP